MSDVKELNPCSFTENSKTLEFDINNNVSEMKKIELSGNIEKREHPFMDTWIEDCRVWNQDGFTNLFNMKNKDVKTQRFSTKNKRLKNKTNFKISVFYGFPYTNNTNVYLISSSQVKCAIMYNIGNYSVNEYVGLS